MGRTNFANWKDKAGSPIFWALLATLVFVVLIGFLGSYPTCNEQFFPDGECPPKWRHLLKASPNEVGDTLAGPASILALIWIIATVLLQSQELREQRREFSKMSAAQLNQASQLQQQGGILLDEQSQRREEYADYQADILVSEFVTLSREIYMSRIYLVDTHQTVEIVEVREIIDGKSDEVPGSTELPESLAVDAVRLIVLALKKMYQKNPNLKKLRNSDLEKLLRICSELNETHPRTSKSKRLVLPFYEFELLQDDLYDMLDFTK